VGRAGRCRHHGPAQGPGRPQPGHELDTDRGHGRTHLPSVALRSANLRLQGNGQGAVSPQAYLAELPSLVEEIDAGTIEVNARPVPLADVEATWSAPEVPGIRTVFTP